jgi:hypothetical protein
VCTFKIGDVIEVFGLQSQEGLEINGCRGCIERHAKEEGRFLVRCELGEGSETKVANLKVANMKKIEPKVAAIAACLTPAAGDSAPALASAKPLQGRATALQARRIRPGLVEPSDSRMAREAASSQISERVQLPKQAAAQLAARPKQIHKSASHSTHPAKEVSGLQKAVAKTSDVVQKPVRTPASSSGAPAPKMPSADASGNSKSEDGVKRPLVLPKTGALLVGMPDGSVRLCSSSRDQSTRTTESGNLKAGMNVRVIGLKSRQDMNGKIGRLIAFDLSDKRWEIKFDQAMGKLRANHIEVVDGHTQDNPDISAASSADEAKASSRQIVRDGLLPLEAYLEDTGAVRKGCAAAVVALMDYYTKVELRLGILYAIEKTRQQAMQASFVKAGCVTHLVSWMEQCFVDGGNVSEELLLKCFDVLELLPPFSNIMLTQKERTTLTRLEDVCTELQSQYPDLAALELVRRWIATAGSPKKRSAVAPVQDKHFHLQCL